MLIGTYYNTEDQKPYPFCRCLSCSDEKKKVARRPPLIMHRSLATTRKQGFLLAKYESFQVCIACLFLVGSLYTLPYFTFHDKVQKGHQYLQSLNAGNSCTISCYIHVVKCLGYLVHWYSIPSQNQTPGSLWQPVSECTFTDSTLKSEETKS